VGLTRALLWVLAKYNDSDSLKGAECEGVKNFCLGWVNSPCFVRLVNEAGKGSPVWLDKFFCKYRLPTLFEWLIHGF